MRCRKSHGASELRFDAGHDLATFDADLLGGCRLLVAEGDDGVSFHAKLRPVLIRDRDCTASRNDDAPTGVGEFNRTNADVKINYESGNKLTIFGRYSISPTLIIDPPIFGEVSGPALKAGQR